MDKYRWRDKEEFGDKTDYVKCKVLKSRLYFLGQPRDLKKIDVYRHVCKECRRVFHKSQGLEWHIMDEHPHLEQKKELENAKRKKAKVRAPPVPTHEAALVIPKASESTFMNPEPIPDISGQGQAQSRGRRRSRRISGEQPDPTLTHEDLCLTPTKKAKDRSSSRDTCASPRATPRTSRKSTLPVQTEAVSGEEELVRKYNIKECDVKLQTLKLVDSPDRNNNMKDGRPNDDSVILVTDSNNSVVDLSLSSHNLSSQIESWEAPENNTAVADDEDLPRLAAVKDKVQWWLQMI